MENVKLFELKKTETNFKRVKIDSSEKASEFIRQFYGDDMVIYESFFILLLDRSNHTIGYAKISQGGICGTYVDSRIVLKYVVESLACGVILCHNHPSGTLLPSDQDIHLTKNIQKTLDLLDVSLLDHIILTEVHYYSFKDNFVI